MMQNTLHRILLTFWLSSPAFIFGQADSTGFDGDHLNLAGVLCLFKESADIDAFEKALNMESSKVNNLDLNKDGDVDFIFVKEMADGDSRTLVLSVAINDTEMQDVAAIAIDRQEEDQINLQIFGEEEVYGSSVILEPLDADGTRVGGKGMARGYEDQEFLGCNVCAWGSIRYLYMPDYRPHQRPARWSLYKEWWMRWRAIQWHSYSRYCNPWGINFYPTTKVVCARAHGLWRRNYVVCPKVHHRYVEVKKQRNEANKRDRQGDVAKKPIGPTAEKDVSSKKTTSKKTADTGPRPSGPKAKTPSKGGKPTGGKHQSKSAKPTMKNSSKGQKSK